MEYVNKFCPICSSENIQIVATDLYICNNCDYMFNSDDVEHERLRRYISAFCSALYATEDNPINCLAENLDELRIEGIDEAAQGLSEAEKPQISQIFQGEDGIIWVTTTDNGVNSNIPEPIDVDSIITVSLKQIVQWLEENTSVKQNIVTF